MGAVTLGTDTHARGRVVIVDGVEIGRVQQYRRWGYRPSFSGAGGQLLRSTGGLYRTRKAAVAHLVDLHEATRKATS